MLNQNDNQLKTLMDLGLEAEAKNFSLLVSPQEKNDFLFNLVKQYLKEFDFDKSIILGKKINDKNFKEFTFQLILKNYLRRYLINNKTQEIDHNLIQRIKKNIKRFNEKSLPKVNQRLKVINLTLESRIDETIEIIERMTQRDNNLVITILIDLLNLGNCGYQILFDILRTSKNYQLKQICYHLFKHHGGEKTKEKIKEYKSETTLIMIHGNEHYQFIKVKEQEKISYQRIKKIKDYKIPQFIFNQGKIIDIEIIRQLLLPYTFIIFTKPYPILLKQIKKDPYLNKIPIIYPQGKSQENISSDGLIKLYQPSHIYLEKISSQHLEDLQKQGINIENKTQEMEQNMSLFIEDILTQI
jgi:hypothetical protein